MRPELRLSVLSLVLLAAVVLVVGEGREGKKRERGRTYVFT